MVKNIFVVKCYVVKENNCKCIQCGCTKRKGPCCKFWCCCYCFFWPVVITSPDYKLRFITFLETLSLLFKLMHYYKFANKNYLWFDIIFQILILSSLIILFLMGFASVWKKY